jgi:hypothetical protein
VTREDTISERDSPGKYGFLYAILCAFRDMSQDDMVCKKFPDVLDHGSVVQFTW